MISQKIVQFKHDSATVHAQWLAVRTYRWVPPRPPEPMTRRQTGWRRCHPPVR
ncbi:hypothetical protein [Synechococcus sp. A15-127]|uniref:hypothetical protein n=1 Tax=Synechococcus sp. A15-127 TaxID=1050624 RepID=UPI001646F446|nr:hypothetical protein [Synechococcus sp. A15-127]